MMPRPLLLGLLILANAADAYRVTSLQEVGQFDNDLPDIDPPDTEAPEYWGGEYSHPPRKEPSLAQVTGHRHIKKDVRLLDEDKVGIRVKCNNLPTGDHSVNMTSQYFHFGDEEQGPQADKLIPYSVSTETVEKSSNPIFSTELLSVYQFYLEQHLSFTVRSGPTGAKSFTANLGELIHSSKNGEMTFSLCDGESMSLKDPLVEGRVSCRSSMEMLNNEAPSTCTLYGFNQAASAATLKVHIKALDLPNTDWTGKGDPYVQVYASQVGKSCHLNHKSQFQWLNGRPVGTIDPNCFGPIPIGVREDNPGPVPGFSTHVIVNDLDPDWGIIDLPIDALCADEFHRMVSVVVWDDDGGGMLNADDLIGSKFMHAKDLTRFFVNGDMGALEKRGKTEERGHLLLTHSERVQKITTGQYLSGGVEIEVMMAIDLTGSNTRQGTYEEQQRGGLHALNGKDLNNYQIMIKGLSDILGQYDSDGHIPLMSFGGLHYSEPPSPEKTELLDNYTVPPDDGSKEGWYGTDGLLRGYEKEINRCLNPAGFEQLGKLTPCFSGPTRFTDVVKVAGEEAKEAYTDGPKQAYKVLVVLTDGDESSDAVPQTLTAIADASKYGLSIITVGIGNGGNENFADLRALDDAVCKARQGARDIVQTIVMQEIRPEELFIETLEELPKQIMSYLYDSRRLIPASSFAGVVPLLASSGGGGDGLLSLTEVTRIVQQAERKELVQKGLKITAKPPSIPNCEEGDGDGVRFFTACYVGC